MYCTLADAVILRRLPDRGVVLHDIIPYFQRSLFYIAFHKTNPLNTLFLQCMQGRRGLLQA